MSDKELMQQALEALEINNQAWKQLADSGDAGFWEAEEQPFYGTSVKAMNALRERLAQPEQELKPWQTEETYDNDGVLIARRMKRGPNCEWEPWLTPPRREWVGLTDEVDELAREMVKGDKSVNWLARAIEAKLREKNA